MRLVLVCISRLINISQYHFLTIRYIRLQSMDAAGCSQCWCLTKALLLNEQTQGLEARLAYHCTLLSNACSNSGEVVGIWPLETATVYLEKYIVLLYRQKSIHLSHILIFFLILQPWRCPCVSLYSHCGQWNQVPKGEFNLKQTSVLIELPLLRLKRSNLRFP